MTISETDLLFEKVKKQAESDSKDNDEYLKDLLGVLLMSYQEQKRKTKKDRKLMEDAIKSLDNEIGRCDYHIGQIKKIMMEKGWTFLDKKGQKER